MLVGKRSLTKFAVCFAASLLFLMSADAQQRPQTQRAVPKPSAPAQRTQKAPQLVDITASTGIRFEHLASPDQRYIVESMGGGVALIDYDGDGWLDIYFTNAPSVSMALAGKKDKSALYHNNQHGTFT